MGRNLNKKYVINIHKETKHGLPVAWTCCTYSEFYNFTSALALAEVLNNFSYSVPGDYNIEGNQVIVRMLTLGAAHRFARTWFES